MIEVKKWLSLALATLALYGSGSGAGVNAMCVRGRTWWDRQRGACVPCTRCEPASHLAVRAPCEVHRDAICASIYELDIWPFTLHENGTGPDYDSGPRDDDGHGADGASASDSAWDARISAVTLAASGCVIFFVVVISLSLNHVRQWKKLKRALRTGEHCLNYDRKYLPSVSTIFWE
ncbi:Tumor necrosis factor receptor superfamily member wengen [Eumeta japonica]|uniref:Tumor necrosis factor receptor superfamily member wengen n=1 Tax=Eumeta variegata TaxID=151549 RepID=A0A4C1X186_EUMVA|nr:Tumor necrosis factor receptor superfamily member wengen [Eumeta japonica]